MHTYEYRLLWHKGTHIHPHVQEQSMVRSKDINVFIFLLPSYFLWSCRTVNKNTQINGEWKWMCLCCRCCFTHWRCSQELKERNCSRRILTYNNYTCSYNSSCGTHIFKTCQICAFQRALKEVPTRGYTYLYYIEHGRDDHVVGFKSLWLLSTKNSSVFLFLKIRSVTNKRVSFLNSLFIMTILTTQLLRVLNCNRHKKAQGIKENGNKSHEC